MRRRLRTWQGRLRLALADAAFAALGIEPPEGCDLVLIAEDRRLLVITPAAPRPGDLGLHYETVRQRAREAGPAMRMSEDALQAQIARIEAEMASLTRLEAVERYRRPRRPNRR